MAQACEYCGKTGKMGNQIETRGKAKYLGGVGTKITGITRRKFKPNLQTLKIVTPTGQTKTADVCTRCIKAGIVRKAVKRRPFKLAAVETTKAKPAAKAKTKA
ncbi:MAG: 50S ribosomal protein L28 [Planctomycetota bacterium]